jgi:hypothetical protein
MSFEVAFFGTFRERELEKFLAVLEYPYVRPQARAYKLQEGFQISA